MLGLVRPAAASEAIATLKALERSQAMIEFAPDGVVLTANQKFLELMGYSLAEIRGKPHSMFVDPAYRASPEYAQFWQKLGRGEYQAAQFRRIAKDGREIWIEASYNPILGRNGKPFKVVKFATDVTQRKTEFANLNGQVEAINKSQASIEFTLDGVVLTANQKFLDLTGYSLAEIQGKRHSMFVDPAHAASTEYRQFWEKLRRGEYQAGQFKRIGRGGQEVWIEASYNSILDLNGKPFKVVKFATDITAQMQMLANFKTLLDHNFAEIEGAVRLSSSQADLASGAVHTTSGTVQTMAASAEELAASVREISDMMLRSKAAADSATTQAAMADKATQSLTAMSTSMGGIVTVISGIAQQINLLALNATIEAARAGDAGRGFAVVASEVKNLAQQAAQATGQISTEISALQSVTKGVVESLAAIVSAIQLVQQFVTGTASSVEEQSAVTQQMSQGMQTASLAMVGINDNMTEITAAVTQVAHAMGDTRKSASVLVR